MGSLFRFFSRYFSVATRPTEFLLTWLVIAQLTLQPFPSLRFLHRNFLFSVTHRCLNNYYQALRNETVTSRSLRLQTAALACSLIPAALQNEPIFLGIDDMMVSKFGNDCTKYQNASPQELRSHLSWQRWHEIFFDTLISKAQTAKNSTILNHVLRKRVSVNTETA